MTGDILNGSARNGTVNGTSYVYLRLSDGARHSNVHMAATVIESMLGDIALEPDKRDQAVYFFALPEDIDPAGAKKIISALVTKAYIDEAWQDAAAGAALTPPDSQPEN